MSSSRTRAKGVELRDTRSIAQGSGWDALDRRSARSLLSETGGGPGATSSNATASKIRFQMLALPDLDVLDALGCDVVTVSDGVTNASHQPRKWHSYDFNGRLPAQVRNPAAFAAQPDGSIQQAAAAWCPRPTSLTRNPGGQPLTLGRRPAQARFGADEKKDLEGRGELKDEQSKAARELCRRVRESTDRAILFNYGALVAPISIHAYGGLAVFPILCLLEPDFVTELHEKLVIGARPAEQSAPCCRKFGTSSTLSGPAATTGATSRT